jgi:hypothetical protein
MPQPRSEWRRGRQRARCTALLLGVLGLLFGVSTPVLPQNSALAGRLGLAEAEREPAGVVSCDNLQASLAGFRQPQRRVDLWVTGRLTLVQTDGVLWYLAICSSPRIRVMCVTYSNNGMKIGDRVTLRGAYRAVDDRHVVLDPCLASRE